MSAVLTCPSAVPVQF